MAGFVIADAVSNVPTYTGKALRLLFSALQSTPTNRPAGGYSGVAPGTPASILAVTSSSWTVQPFGGYLDVSAASDGGTPFAFDAAVTGAVTGADSSNPRVDLLYIQHDDPSELAGPSVPAAVVKYLAGTASAAPSLPTTPARAIPLAQINMPKLNNGAPTITLIAPYTVAAGGVLPVSDSTRYPANPYVGMYIDDATLGLLRWDGTAWQPYGRGGDTGWQAMTSGGAAGSTAKYRRIGSTGEVVANITGASIPSGSSGTIIVSAANGLPASARPVDTTYGAANFGGALSGTAVINTDGSIAVLNNTGSTVSVARCSVPFLVG